MPDSLLRERRCRMPGTKFAVPRPPACPVARPGLLSGLTAGLDALVTLVIAPAGYGKTSLLAEWARNRGRADTAWVALDPDDNEDERFWSALLAALSGCDAVPEDNPVRWLAVPAGPSADPDFLADVVNALDALPNPVWLVLDDVHELTHPRSLRGLAAVLAYEPAGLRLVLAARQDPLLPLGRLRLTDQLTELRAEHLRFSRAEAVALFVAAGLDLDEERVGRLHTQTEGWPAGLRLAALSLGDPASRDVLVEDLANDPTLAEYLGEEVLSGLPGQMGDLLTAISVCDEVPVGLATDLAGRADTGVLLESLVRRTSLVVRADAAAPRYRVHRLLRAHLRAELGRHDPVRAAALHAVAARWFAGQDEAAPALSHAELAGDPALVDELARRYALTLLLRGELDLVRRVLAARPPVEDTPLSLVSALLWLELGETAHADQDLAAAEAVWPAEPTAEVVVLYWLVRSDRARVSGDVTELALATEHLDSGFAADARLDALCRLHRGSALVAMGRTRAAMPYLDTALRVATEGGYDYLVALCTAAFASAEGAVERMAELAGEVLDRHTRNGWRHTLASATARGLLGYAALLRADPRECLRHVTDAGERTDDDPRLLAETLRGAAEFELGDWTGGARRVLNAALAVGETRCPADLVAMTTMLGHRTALLLGWGAAAAHHLRWAESAVPDAGEVRVLRARGQLALGRHDAAGRIVRPVLDGTAPVLLPWTAIEAWLLDCEVALLSGVDERAHRAVKKALREGQRLAVTYPLVFARPAVLAFLTGRRGALGAVDDFAQRVLAIREALRPPSVPARLTASERAILHLLPAFRSLDEIAADLMVSPNTVKTHVRSIYAKLGVSRRAGAVEIAARCGLLDFEGHRAG